MSQPRSSGQQRLPLVGAEAVLVELLVGADARPGALRGGAQRAEDQVQLVLHCGSREQRPATDHLVHDAAHAPAAQEGEGAANLTAYILFLCCSMC